MKIIKILYKNLKRKNTKNNIKNKIFIKEFKKVKNRKKFR